MAADSDGGPEPAGIWDDRLEAPVDVRVEHNGEQTLVGVESERIHAAAAVDVGDLSLDQQRQLANDLLDAFQAATSSGGDE
jgi:hypothetical protein